MPIPNRRSSLNVQCFTHDPFTERSVFHSRPIQRWSGVEWKGREKYLTDDGEIAFHLRSVMRETEGEKQDFRVSNG